MKPIVTFFISFFSLFFQSQETFKDITRNLKTDNALLDTTYRKISGDTVSLRKLLTLSEKNRNGTAQSFFLNKLGVFYRDKSKYSDAFNLHQKALKIAKSNDNLEQIIISENLLGVVFRRKDEIIPAIEHHQKALELAESIKNPNETILRNVAISCNSLGNVYLTMNHLDDALQYFQRSLKIEKKIKTHQINKNLINLLNDLITQVSDITANIIACLKISPF